MVLKRDQRKLRVCPNCMSEFKIVEKCFCCQKEVCRLCSMDKLCMECFVKVNIKKERNVYYNEKAEERIKCEIKLPY